MKSYLYLKRIVCLALVPVIMLAGITVFSISSAYAAEELIPGDADCDGRFTILDATLIQKVLCELIVPTDDFDVRGDADCDGIVNIKDVTMIQKIIAGLAYSPALPRPTTAVTTTIAAETTNPSETTVPETTEEYIWNQQVIKP